MSRYIDAEWLLNFFVDIPDNFTLTIGNLRATVNEAPSIEPKQGEWIPCSKKMPNEGDRIVVQYADGSLGLINSCRMRIWNIPNSPYSKVVAWMYIEPWKGTDDVYD